MVLFHIATPLVEAVKREVKTRQCKQAAFLRFVLIQRQDVQGQWFSTVVNGGIISVVAKMHIPRPYS